MEIAIGLLSVGLVAAVAAAVWVFTEERAINRRAVARIIAETNVAFSYVGARLDKLEAGGKVLPFVRPKHRGPPPGGPRGLS